ncbi:hypothetical protein HDV00_006495 [Rhizophlyctis rosea]|nr:hypothetical protein HDV00_006495 [Rhizophlyctis rosea]
MEAMAVGSLAMVELLVEAGADLSKSDGLRRRGGLLDSCRGGHLDVVKYTLDRLGIGDNETLPPLTSIDNFDVLELLLQLGADIEAKVGPKGSKYMGNAGYTALMSAIKSKKNEKAKFLINHGANIHATNWIETQTPISLAAYNSNGLPLIKLLWERGAQLDLHILQCAAMHGSLDTLQFILRQTRDVLDLNQIIKPSPFTVIQQADSWRKVRELIQAGADPTIGVSEGVTILHRYIIWLDRYTVLAEDIRNEQRELVGLILSKGVDVNSVDSAGRTPLDCALEKNDSALDGWCEILKEFGGEARFDAGESV